MHTWSRSCVSDRSMPLHTTQRFGQTQQLVEQLATQVPQLSGRPVCSHPSCRAAPCRSHEDFPNQMQQRSPTLTRYTLSTAVVSRLPPSGQTLLRLVLMCQLCASRLTMRSSSRSPFAQCPFNSEFQLFQVQLPRLVQVWPTSPPVLAVASHPSVASPCWLW